MLREEAISILNYLKEYYNDKDECGHVEFDDEDNEALDMAIEALEQEPVLDKIRAEIEQEPYVSKMEVLEIIDKYVVESEEV